jgi:hypothetical protein
MKNNYYYDIVKAWKSLLTYSIIYNVVALGCSFFFPKVTIGMLIIEFLFWAAIIIIAFLKLKNKEGNK